MTAIPQRRPIALVPVLVALLAGAAVAGTAAWQLNLQSIGRQIEEKRGAVKKLLLSGRVPPNEDVMAYLASRQTSLEGQYQHWIELVAAPALASAASADPQLYFQEQFHEVQRTLERLATARNVAVPEQLGFPKELPPSDTVPRLLAQLSLMQEAATLIFEQGAATLSSLKVEDPETVNEEGEETAFLTRLPVRVRLNATLPQLVKVLGALERARPLIDVRALRVSPTQTEDRLDVELVLARYLVVAQSAGLPPAEDRDHTGSAGSKPARPARARDGSPP